MDQLGRAGEAMGDAEGQLGEGNADGAVRFCRGARSRRCAAAPRTWRSHAAAGLMGPGPASPAASVRRVRNRRPIRSAGRCADAIYGDDVTVKVPGEIDVQRARRILEELRRRFGEPLRPQLELEYIERLLRDFY